MLGREVVERQQHFGVVDDLRGGLGPLGAVGLRELVDRLLGVDAVLGVADLLHRLRCARLGGLRQGVVHISGSANPAALVAGRGEHLGQGLPQAHHAVVDHQFWVAHAASAAVAQQLGPRLSRLAQPLRDGDQLLGSVDAHPEQDQDARVRPARGGPSPGLGHRLGTPLCGMWMSERTSSRRRPVQLRPRPPLSPQKAEFRSS